MKGDAGKQDKSEKPDAHRKRVYSEGEHVPVESTKVGAAFQHRSGSVGSTSRDTSESGGQEVKVQTKEDTGSNSDSHVASVIQRMEARSQVSSKSKSSSAAATQEPLERSPKPAPPPKRTMGEVSQRRKADNLEARSELPHATPNDKRFVKPGVAHSPSVGGTSGAAHRSSDSRTANGRKSLEAAIERARGMTDRPDSSKPKPENVNPHLVQLLSQLQEQAAANDYYGLLGVEAGATEADLARARREKSRELHPDHFASDPERRAR